MTLADFCKKHGIAGDEVRRIESYLHKQDRYKIKTNFTGNFVIDSSNESQVLELVNEYRSEYREEQRRLREEEAFLLEEEERIAEVVRAMPITSTQSFDGYRIMEYGGYVSGDEAIELTDSYFGNGDFDKDVVNDKLKEVRSVAIDELKTAAAQIGCNAVVGLDFDYVTIDRQFPGISGRTVNRSFIILTANGTAVTIEPV